jgi:hypothetical protein
MTLLIILTLALIATALGAAVIVIMLVAALACAVWGMVR